MVVNFGFSDAIVFGPQLLGRLKDVDGRTKPGRNGH
jgi:hypothetical protein